MSISFVAMSRTYKHKHLQCEKLLILLAGKVPCKKRGEKNGRGLYSLKSIPL